MRKALDHAGMSVQAMSRYLEVSRQSIGNWVNDRVSPSKQTLRLWALRTGVPLEWLETGEAPTSRTPGPGSYTTRDSNPEPADLESFRMRRSA